MTVFIWLHTSSFRSGLVCYFNLRKLFISQRSIDSKRPIKIRPIKFVTGADISNPSFSQTNQF